MKCSYPQNDHLVDCVTFDLLNKEKAIIQWNAKT